MEMAKQGNASKTGLSQRLKCRFKLTSQPLVGHQQSRSTKRGNSTAVPSIAGFCYYVSTHTLSEFCMYSDEYKQVVCVYNNKL